MSSSSGFNALMGGLDYPMFIVTTPEPAGCLVGFATQASIDPPRFLVCISKTNHTFRSLDGELAVHLVPDSEPALVELFGGETGDEVDKFARCAWHRGPAELPILEACPSWFCGRTLERVDCGDHMALLLEPFAVEHGHGERPFPFHRAKRIEPGHAP